MTWPLNCVRRTEPLANHTSFRIGGPAEWFAEPSTIEETLTLLRLARRMGMPVSVMGGGTNLLVADRGIGGLVLHLGRAFRTVESLPSSQEPQARVRCGASVLTQHLVTLACQSGWGEVEVLAGLPGQVGGAIAMNAQNIGQFVESITLISFEGTVRQFTQAQLHFTYRYTALEPGIVVEAIFRFPCVPPAVAAERIQQVLRHRNTTQDLRLPSAGCAFKNPPGTQAGRLIDQNGLKGARIGDAQISMRHANFIVNVGQASCDDVLSLMESVQYRVMRKTGVWLEPEVRLLGEQWRGHTSAC